MSAKPNTHQTTTNLPHIVLISSKNTHWGGGSSLLDKAPAANHSGALPRLSADISHFQSRPASPPRLHLSKLALATLLALASCHHVAFAAREQPDSNNFIKQPAPNTGIEIINDGTYNVAAGFELKDLT